MQRRIANICRRLFFSDFTHVLVFFQIHEEEKGLGEGRGEKKKGRGEQKKGGGAKKKLNKHWKVNNVKRKRVEQKPYYLRKIHFVEVSAGFWLSLEPVFFCFCSSFLSVIYIALEFSM